MASPPREHVRRDLPFPHLIFAPVLPAAVVDALHARLDGAEWREVRGDFYRFKIPARPETREALLASLDRHLPTPDLRATLAEGFGCALDAAPRLEVHRYDAGDGIGAHTDAATPEVRLILSIDPAWTIEDASAWVFARDASLRTDRAYLPAIGGTGYAFRTRADSFHALTVRRRGTGYGLTLRLACI